MDAAGTLTRGDLLVRDGAIAAVGDCSAALAAIPGGRPDERIDATGGFVLPGFVHGHLHLCQTLFRGLAEQSDLLRWLREAIWPLEHAHTEASIAASVRLGLVELLAGGVTCINDMGTVRHTEAIGAELEASGIRAVFGKALMDAGEGVPRGMLETRQSAMATALALAERFQGAGGGRLQVSLAPRFILSCSEGLWQDVATASKEKGLLVHTHLAENASEGREVADAVGSSAARFFAMREVLSERFVGAHGVWLEDDELSALKRADAALVHCPGSNLKLGSGFANVQRWRTAGVRCGLGSDGAACNNRLDTFYEMSLASGLSRTLEPERHLPARDVLALATCEGARALGLGAKIGSLDVGKQADCVIVDAFGPHVAPDPDQNPYAAIVHACRASDVRMTMVAGRVLYRAATWATLDADRAVRDAQAEAQRLVQRMEAA